MAQNTPNKCCVVGAGPVGCLAALAMARLGWNVEVYERRLDMRLLACKSKTSQRSINLTISSRGISAIAAIDPAAAARVMQTVIPMSGRMIHDEKGNQESQQYDKDKQCINSIDRALLNEDLLNEAASLLNVHIFFQNKVSRIDFDKKNMVIQDMEAKEQTQRQVHFDFCIGADGSYSMVRAQMMRVVRMDFQQTFIPDEYVELKIPAGRGPDGQATFLLDPSHLHIWPRHSFMLIAMPNKDKTFTCTVFAPNVELNKLNSSDAILSWFKSNFPHALAIIGEDVLLADFQRNPRNPLISTKSKPYHYKDRAILLGDAAHSMVPFYGQGLNCGLEDVRVLCTLLREEKVGSTAHSDPLVTNENLARALTRYSENRHEDLVSICDLAMSNYVEIRHSVTTPAYLFKKSLDNILYTLSSGTAVTAASLGSLLSTRAFALGKPFGWLPLYTMVTFRPDISYSSAKRKAEQQARILSGAGWAAGSLVLGAATMGVSWMVSRSD